MQANQRVHSRQLCCASSSTRSRYLESRHNGMIAIVSAANIVRLSQRWFRAYVLPDISFGASPRSMSATPHPSESIMAFAAK